jgi:ERCC4-related helicase
MTLVSTFTLSLAPSPRVGSSAWLQTVLCAAANVPSLRDFQLELASHICKGTDVFLVIATAKGKTLVLLSGLIAAHARHQQGIGFLIFPTKALAIQQVCICIIE